MEVEVEVVEERVVVVVVGRGNMDILKPETFTSK